MQVLTALSWKKKIQESYITMCLCAAELNRAGLEPGDTEQVIHHLHRELLEAQELANTGKQRCLELQGNITWPSVCPTNVLELSLHWKFTPGVHTVTSYFILKRKPNNPKHGVSFSTVCHLKCCFWWKGFTIPVFKSAALLEDEKRSNSKQTEESTKQIQFLQS